MTQDINLKSPPEPSASEVRKYIKKWGELPNYVQQEKSLIKLFKETYKENKKIKDVHIKVCVLNEFYSTRLSKPYINAIAKHIVDLKIDKRIESGCHTIVNEIGKQITAEFIKDKDITTGGIEEKKRRNYSFATKYCHFSFLIYQNSNKPPNPYPLYDSYVREILIYFHCKSKFFEDMRDEKLKGKKLNDDKEFRCHQTFFKIIEAFKKHYKIEKFTTKEIDQYLWLVGQGYQKSKNKK